MKAAQLTRVDATRRAATIGDVEYRVDADLTDAQGGLRDRVFHSRSEITFSARGGAGFVDVMADRVLSATLNGRQLDTSSYDGRQLELPDLAERNTLVVEAEFEFANEWRGLQRVVDPTDDETYVVSMTFMAAARSIYACFDQPDLKARFTFTATTPRDWVVLSNGAVAEQVPTASGAQRTRFERTAPMPTYVTALVAGPYHAAFDTVDGPDGPIRLGLYCPRSAAAHLDPDGWFAETKAGFEVFHRTFDHPYPYGPSYDQILTSEPGWGAMENAAAVTFCGGMLFRSRVTEHERLERAYTILHELSHMWFGNLVTTRWWDDTWLNEAFATYAGFFAMVEGTGRTHAWSTLACSYKVRALTKDQYSTSHPISADAPDLQTALANFDGITYNKGAAVLRQLVAYVGRDAFDRGLQAYFREHAFGNTSLADLLAALAASSGRDLDAWSRQWLQTTGVNTLTTELDVAPDGTYRRVSVAQSGGSVLRDHRIVLGLYDEQDDRLVRRSRVELDVSGERTDVTELVGVPAADLVVLDDEDLTYAKVRLDPGSLDVVLARLGTLAEPLARTVCWTALWDMLRDGELSAPDWIDAVLRGIDAESVVDVLRWLLDSLGVALSRFAEPGRVPALAARLADHAWAALTTAPARSDHQLLWWRFFGTVAAGTPHAATLRAVYDGEQTIDGVTLDLDARWSLLHELVAHGRAGAADIDAEYARDRNAASEQAAARARAVLPDPAAKEAAWELAVTDGDTPLAIRESAAEAFWHPAQQALLEPYVARWFDGLDQFWKLDEGGGQTYVTTLGLRPEPTYPGIVAAARLWLDTPDRPELQRRAVTELLEDTERALRNRAV